MTAKKAQAKRDEKILKAVAKGNKTYNEIAAEYGLTRARIDQIVLSSPNADELRTAHMSKRNDERKKILNHAIAAEMTYTEIANTYGKDQNYWRSWATKLGLADQIVSRHEKIVKRNTEVIEYLEAGHSQAETAAKFGIGQSAVSGILIKSGGRRRVTGDALKTRNDAIVEQLKAGKTNNEIAAEFDVSPATVYNAGRAAGVIEPVDRDTRNKKITECLKSGKSIKKTASEVGCSEAIVRNVKAKNEANVRHRLTGEAKAERDSRIVAAYKEGKTYDALSKQFRVSVATIYNAITTNDEVGQRTEGRVMKLIDKQARDEQIVKDYQAGKTYEEIARDNECCASTVYKAVTNAGVLRRK